MEKVYRQRVQRALRALKKNSAPSALVLGPAPHRRRSRDDFFAHRQDSDFYYLTGSQSDQALLVLHSEKRLPTLIVPQADPHKVLWEGPPPPYKQEARRIGAELVVSKDPVKEVRSRLRGVEILYFQNVSESRGWHLARELIELPSAERGVYPRIFAHSDVVLEPMRLQKDPAEVAAIAEAAEIAGDAFTALLPMVHAGTTERQVAQWLDFAIHELGGEPAFTTIVASGASAATLHHRPTDRKLKAGELLLIDWGARKNMYASDITRVVPVSGDFTPLQAELYDVVAKALAAALKKIHAGALIKSVYDAAVAVLTDGLIELKVLKGKRAKLVADGKHRPFFPHGIGHSLGLDVHDIGRHRGNNGAILEEGMVFTIEPGLYFPRKLGRLDAPCGIRLEQDVVVTKRGYRLLTQHVPVRRGDLLEMLGAASALSIG